MLDVIFEGMQLGCRPLGIARGVLGVKVIEHVLDERLPGPIHEALAACFRAVGLMQIEIVLPGPVFIDKSVTELRRVTIELRPRSSAENSSSMSRNHSCGTSRRKSR